MEPSVFTKIVAGEIPCHKIYEDDKTLAFLDIHPIQEGHVLVIPKEQIEFVWDLPEDLYDAVMHTARKVALRMQGILPHPHVHLGIVGTDVPHAHVHLIPFTQSSELHVPQNTDIEPDHSVLVTIAERLRFS